MGKLNQKAVGSKPRNNHSKKPSLKKKTGSHGNAKTEADSKPTPKITNPFEVKVNKQKFHVLGRPTKHERGLPGVSRARALKKRTNTLLEEYKNRFKSNKMIDKRLGENNPKLTVEGKMEMRFLAEKIKTQNKVVAQDFKYQIAVYLFSYSRNQNFFSEMMRYLLIEDKLLKILKSMMIQEVIVKMMKKRGLEKLLYQTVTLVEDF